MRRTILSIVFLVLTALVAPCPPAPAQSIYPITTPMLASAPNFRDVAGISSSFGGTGFSNVCANFGVMRTGVFYRSDVLSLSPPDLTTLSSLHIFRDIDLRTPGEISVTPDVVPAGTLYSNINVFGTSNLPSASLSSTAAALSSGQSGYRTFVTDPTERAGFGSVLLTLAHDPGPDLYHCSDGKDRTGWTSVLLQSIAGVPQATIMQDYLASNLYLAPVISARSAPLVAAQPGLAGTNFNPFFGVDSSYLQAALNQVTASYGSMSGYLIQGLGLTPADIYVLRAKMVYYTLLPGQGTFGGNAGTGVALLNALQNSPLSGQYTSYNFFLQSGIDAGTLGAVPAQVGGQVHADGAAHLLSQSRDIDEATGPYVSGRNLGEGQADVWIAGLGNLFRANGHDAIASSTQYSAGSIAGITYRVNNRTSLNMGLGYDWGRVESVSATADMNTILATIGGRYGFESLDEGPYLTANAKGGWVDYQSSRPMAGGLGTADGSTNGAVYSGLAGIGETKRLSCVTIAPQLGVRVDGVTLAGFKESGSELALNVNGTNKTTAGLLADLYVSLNPQQLGAWTVAPAVTLGYERMLSDPQVQSNATIYGCPVSQKSAYDSRDLFKAGLGFTAQRGDLTLQARANAVVGDQGGSTGIGGHLSISYNF
jgi:protein tyrosine/serine phosphatase